MTSIEKPENSELDENFDSDISESGSASGDSDSYTPPPSLLPKKRKWEEIYLDEQQIFPRMTRAQWRMLFAANSSTSSVPPSPSLLSFESCPISLRKQKTTLKKTKQQTKENNTNKTSSSKGSNGNKVHSSLLLRGGSVFTPSQKETFDSNQSMSDSFVLFVPIWFCHLQIFCVWLVVFWCVFGSLF
jgi:hypothetical protein